MTESRRISVRTFGIIRGLLQRFTRGQMHQLLLEAGSEAALAVPFTADMNSPRYRQKEAILSEGLDTPFRKLPPEEANTLVLELVRAMARRARDIIVNADNGLENALRADGMGLAEVLEHGKTEISKQAAALA